MPSGVFKPYAGVSTAVLIFTKTGHGGTDKVWFYDMQADGLSLDDKRSPVAENDIPDIIKRFRSLSVSKADSSPKGRAKGGSIPAGGRCPEEDRKRTDKSFLVPKQEIVDNGYDLSINKYKQTEYVAVEYPPTQEIMARIDENMVKLGQTLDELRNMLKQ